MEHVTLLAAFAAGFFSFASPCVAPLLPGYAAYVSGVAIDGQPRRRVLAAALAFVLGFSLLFITIGASATAAGQFVASRQSLFARLAGSLVILVGFHTLGVIRLDRLAEARRAAGPGVLGPAGAMGALLVGVAFVFGWTPCIGPVLTAILFVGGADETVGRGVLLLAVYSLGLAVPFLGMALGIEWLCSRVNARYRCERVLAAASGTLLVLLGAFIFTGRVTVFAELLTPYLPVF